MKKFLVLGSVMLLMGACLPLQSAPTSDAPQVDSQATIDTIVQFSVQQTVAALPSPTAVPATDTPNATATASPTTEVTESPSPTPNLTTTPVTATVGTPLNTPTVSTSATDQTPELVGGATMTPTLGVMKYGTMPPAVAYEHITLINKSKVQAYISLQNYPPDGPAAILEYPVATRMRIDAPIGRYIYVAWVGGRQITGKFSLARGTELIITIYQDKITIQQGN